jgi:hypothetical protein
MTGPAFHNSALPEDVDNNGVINTVDLLIVLNFLNYLRNQLIVQPGQLTLPITTPPYQAGTPTFDPTGGGVPGQGLYIDVAAPFGEVTTADLNTIVTWLTLNFDPGVGGEGEGEGGSTSLAGAAAAQSGGAAARSSGGSSGTSSSTSVASSAAKSALLAPVALFASPNIVIEERIVQSGPALDDDSWLDSGSDDTLDLVASASPTDEGAIGRYLSIEETTRRRIPYGPLEADAWDDLLSDLSLDVGGLPGDTEDDS